VNRDRLAPCAGESLLRVDTITLKGYIKQKRAGDLFMTDEAIKRDKRVIEVELNEQQAVILKRLKEDGRYGVTDGEIIRKVYREFLKRAQISA
jgi:hypothetical protein